MRPIMEKDAWRLRETKNKNKTKVTCYQIVQENHHAVKDVGLEK